MASSPRDPRRYDTDLTDEQWAVVEALLPPPSKDGPKEKHPRREIVNAIFYLVRTGCAWRHLPSDFPPWQTVYGWFARWSDDGTVARVHDRLRNAVRDEAGRDPMASAGDRGRPVGPGRGHRRGDQPRIRRREEDQWSQAPHRGGHPGPAHGRDGDRGQRAGPRRRPWGVGPG